MVALCLAQTRCFAFGAQLIVRRSLYLEEDSMFMRAMQIVIFLWFGTGHYCTLTCFILKLPTMLRGSFTLIPQPLQ